MKTAVLFALAGLTAAQLNGLDWDAIDAAGPPVTETVPAGVVEATTADYIPATAAASVASAVKESPLTTALAAIATPTPSAPSQRRRRRNRLTSSSNDEQQNIHARDPCDAQPLGSGPTASPDTAQGFLDFPAFHGAANGASTPSGYELSFQNLNGSVEANGKIMGWSTLGSYDVGACASNCDGVDGCRAFNIYFERDPSLVSIYIFPFSGVGCSPGLFLREGYRIKTSSAMACCHFPSLNDGRLPLRIALYKPTNNLFLTHPGPRLNLPKPSVNNRDKVHPLGQCRVPQPRHQRGPVARFLIPSRHRRLQRIHQIRLPPPRRVHHPNRPGRRRDPGAPRLLRVRHVPGCPHLQGQPL